MDVYSGYNKIKMNLVDASKTTFMSNHGNYYYNALPFDLKNTSATYQRLGGCSVVKTNIAQPRGVY